MDVTMTEFSPGFADLLADSRYAVTAEASQIIGAANPAAVLPAGLKEKEKSLVDALSCDMFTNPFFLTAPTVCVKTGDMYVSSPSCYRHYSHD